MKNKEKILESYLDFIFEKERNNFTFATDVIETATAFRMGWNSAEEELKKIVEQLQKEDISSTVYILREVLKRMKI